MSVIICKECGQEIDANSKQCPNCGFVIEQEKETIQEVEQSDLICKKCGTLLKENQQFCPKCGTEKGFTNNKKCHKCGAILEPGEKFCSKCGTKAKLDFHSDLIDKTKNIHINKKIVRIIVVIIAILIIVGIVSSKVMPSLTVSVDELLSEGKYEEAYEKAKEKEKEKIEYENLIAYVSNEASESLKDPSSFKLRDAWYDKENQRIVLYVNGNNSYGASVAGYWYYTYDEDDNEYQLFTSLSSLDDEKTYSWDDSSEILEKTLKNAARTIVKAIIADDDLKIDESSVDNINNLFKNDLLDDVELLEINRVQSSSGSDAI